MKTFNTKSNANSSANYSLPSVLIFGLGLAAGYLIVKMFGKQNKVKVNERKSGVTVPVKPLVVQDAKTGATKTVSAFVGVDENGN